MCDLLLPREVCAFWCVLSSIVILGFGGLVSVVRCLLIVAGAGGALSFNGVFWKREVGRVPGIMVGFVDVLSFCGEGVGLGLLVEDVSELKL